ncbi:MAG: response regulator [Chitinophagales bacterium]|nr:response regulator [Chitinophagales bacterium]
MDNNNHKYKIGYLDEEMQWVEKFKRDLKDFFEIVVFDLNADLSLVDIVKRIEEAELDCLLVDYELNEADVIQFNGNDVIEKIKEKYPYFPVFIITGKEEKDVLEQVEDGDIVRLKDELNDKRPILIQRIKLKIENHHKQIQEAEETIKKLIEKRNSEVGLSLPDEELLTEKYLFLEKINPSEKTLPNNLIQPESITKLNEFVLDTKQILEELKKLNK